MTAAPYRLHLGLFVALLRSPINTRAWTPSRGFFLDLKQGVPLDFLKNLALRLQATGPAAVICVGIISVTLLRLFGGANAATALTFLGVAGGMILVTLAMRA